MSVSNPNVIDAIGIDRESGEIVLTIADPLEWDGCKEHLLVLQDKINRYLDFLDAGELIEYRPDVCGRLVRIDIVCKHVPNPEGLRFLSLAQVTIEEAGYKLSWRYFPSNQIE